MCFLRSIASSRKQYSWCEGGRWGWGSTISKLFPSNLNLPMWQPWEPGFVAGLSNVCLGVDACSWGAQDWLFWLLWKSESLGQEVTIIRIESSMFPGKPTILAMTFPDAVQIFQHKSGFPRLHIDCWIMFRIDQFDCHWWASWSQIITGRVLFTPDCHPIPITSYHSLSLNLQILRPFLTGRWSTIAISQQIRPPLADPCMLPGGMRRNFMFFQVWSRWPPVEMLLRSWPTTPGSWTSYNLPQNCSGWYPCTRWFLLFLFKIAEGSGKSKPLWKCGRAPASDRWPASLVDATVEPFD